MTPALFIRISSLVDDALKVSAAFFMDDRDARSSSRNVIFAFGAASLILFIAASAFDGVLAAK